MGHLLFLFQRYLCFCILYVLYTFEKSRNLRYSQSVLRSKNERAIKNNARGERSAERNETKSAMCYNNAAWFNIIVVSFCIHPVPRQQIELLRNNSPSREGRLFSRATSTSKQGSGRNTFPLEVSFLTIRLGQSEETFLVSFRFLCSPPRIDQM